MAPAKNTSSASDPAAKPATPKGGAVPPKRSAVPTDELVGTDSSPAPVAETASAPTNEAAEDDLRRRYREALERKRAGGSAAATGHGADKSAAPTSNDKVKRTFRRRAGG